MHRNKIAWLALAVLSVGICSGQVVPPVEIQDTQMQTLQRQNINSLKLTGQQILAHHFAFPFYLSQKLDIDQQQQLRTDQNSLRFELYDGQTVLAISGNYYAAYSQKFDEEQRAKETLLQVILPILKIAVSHFGENSTVQGYAVEISHHVVRKSIGLSVERPENMMTFLPQQAAIALVHAKSEGQQEAAMLRAQVFLNAEPLSIWLSEGGTRTAKAVPHKQAPTAQESPLARTEADLVKAVDTPVSPAESAPPLSSAPKHDDVQSPAPPPRDTSKAALAALQSANHDLTGRVMKELDAQAHFVSYAPPAFIIFRQGIYLELSINTSLPASAAGSRYKLGALAFDDHVAHLIRPLLGYFKGEQNFDGIGISTTVHLAGKTGTVPTDSQAVEFFLPFHALHCYERYDCTGQQLIDAGTVLINGERVGMDLQNAEAYVH